MSDESLNMGDIEMIDGGSFPVTYKQANNEDVYAGNTCIAIASFTTSLARIKLFDLIQQVEDESPLSSAYVDTGSLCYILKPGMRQVECGNFLGKLTDEL